MTQIRHLRLAVVTPSVIMGAMVGGALGACASTATSARPLTLTAVNPQLTSGPCANASCSLMSAKADGKGTSNLSTGAGSYHANLVIDTSPGGACNIVTENATFSFHNGTISVHSHHKDCANTIDTTFKITGGTGAFHGASGDGRETSPANDVIYQGTISS